MEDGLSSCGHLGQYQELTRLAYSVLRRCPCLPALGLSVMNPRHPLPPEDLELSRALECGGEAPAMTVMAKEWARALLHAFRETLSVLRLKWEVWPLARRARQEAADVVMKTWVFGAEALSQTADFYYGTLPHHLQKRGIRCVLLCGDARGGTTQSTFARKALSQTQVRYIPEKLLIPVWAPLLTACNQLFTSLRLRRLGKKTSDKKFAAVCAHACLDCLKPFTAATSLYFYIANNAVKTWGAKVFITLYEGQSWEKPSWLGAKTADKDCVTVGYQHTVVMPHSLSLTFPNQGSWEMSAPEVVLCLGEVTKKMMRPGHEACGTRLLPFGSFRLNLDDPIPFSPRPKQQTVLVVPETGVIREAQLLFNFSMRAAGMVPEHRFIFRCHPITPFEEILPHLENRPEEFPNIELSDRDLIRDDFARSSVVLYRGSSSVLYAVLHGLKAIYLHDEGYPSADPLFELKNWREHVSSPGDLVRLLERYASTPEKNAAEEWQRAADYVHTYTMPVDGSSIDRFLDSVGLARGTTV